MEYKYETHLHTRQASACGLSNGRDYIDAYINAGYAGLIVTDHFFNGNTAIDRTLPWEVRVNLFCRGYDEAYAMAKGRNFSVFFGWEYSYGEDEYLIYGLDKTWLLDHPEIMEWDHATLYHRVDRDGGLVVQAHPFRERSYLTTIHLHPYTVHAVEVINGENVEEDDRKARAYASYYDLPMTAGSDIHTSVKAGSKSRGVGFDEPLSSIAEYVQRIKARSGYHIVDDSSRAEAPHRNESNLPVYFYELDGSRRRIKASEAWGN